MSIHYVRFGTPPSAIQLIESGPGVRRVTVDARHDWKRLCEAAGVTYHTRPDGSAYWREDVRYVFSERQARDIERVTVELHRMCIDVVRRFVDVPDFRTQFAFDEATMRAVCESWTRGDKGLMGRMDLSVDGFGTVKLLEYNADTPMLAVETALLQRNLGEVSINTMHESLVRAWAEMGHGRVWFAGDLDDPEEWCHLRYLSATAAEAGLTTVVVDLDDLESREGGLFTSEGERVSALYKTHPWEWAVEEPDMAAMFDGRLHVVEPAWKAVLSNKAILAALWQMYPGHPNLLEAYFTVDEAVFGKDQRWVTKPYFGRQGK